MYTEDCQSIFNGKLKKKYLASYYDINFVKVSFFETENYFLKDDTYLGLKYQMWDEIFFEQIGSVFIENMENELLLHNCNQVFFRIVPKISYSANDYKKLDLLLSSGYAMTTGLVNILRIDTSDKRMWTKLRKSYKNLINKEKKILTYSIIDSNNIKDNENNFLNWIDLYSSAIKRGNRFLTNEMIDTQREMIESNRAFLVIAYQNKEPVSGVMFDITEKKAYYSLSATLLTIETKNRAVSHYLIWKSLEYMVNINIEWLEFGAINYRNEVFHKADMKNINISQFKKGFGGEIVPVFYMSKTLGD